MAFYGLAHGKNASKYLSQVVSLSPCFIGDFSEFYSGSFANGYRLLSSAMWSFGIHSILGPNWEW